MRAVALSMLVACLLLACDREQSTQQPTQVLVTLHSNFDDELARVEVRLFDVREQNRSDGYDFSLSSALTLPFSFAVVPADDKPAQHLLVVVTGRNALGELLAQTKAIAAFEPHEIKALDLWLLQACRSVECASGQTCGGVDSAAGQCSATPTIEGHFIKPGDEKKETPRPPILMAPVPVELGEGGTNTPLDPSDAALDGALRDSGGSSVPDAGSLFDGALGPSGDAATSPADSAVLDARAADASALPDTGVMLPADPTLPLVSSCTRGSTDACGSYMAEFGLINLGTMGAIMEPNVGAAFANTVSAGDNLAACSSVIQGYGYTQFDADFLADPGTVDLRLYTLYRPANWQRGARYPVVVWGNGSCLYPEMYGGLLRAIASQGYIVIAPNLRIVDGAELLNALRFLLPLNDNSASSYYLRMDIGKIAVIGSAASATSAGADPRVSTAVLMGGAGNMTKPFLMIGADLIEGLFLNQLMNATSQANASAYVFLHGHDYDGSLIGLRQPDRLAAPITSWLKYRLENDATSRAMFVGSSCGLCNRASDFDYGQKGLN